jgi:hypothetical protein
MELKTEAAFRHTRSFLASGHLDEVVTFSFGGCLSSSSICLTQNFSTFLEKDLIFIMSMECRQLLQHEHCFPHATRPTIS